MYLIVVLALQQFGGSFQNRLKSYIPAKIESLLIKTQQHALLLLSRPLIFVVALILFGSSGMPVVLKLASIAYRNDGISLLQNHDDSHRTKIFAIDLGAFLDLFLFFFFTS